MGTESAHTPDRDTPLSAWPRLVARLVTAPDGTRECTIHPEDATPEELLTVWITATGDSFVALDEMR